MLDKTGKNAEGLKKKKLYLLDMDGTIYNENQIFDGTLDFLEEIEKGAGSMYLLPIIPQNLCRIMWRR